MDTLKNCRNSCKVYFHVAITIAKFERREMKRPRELKTRVADENHAMTASDRILVRLVRFVLREWSGGLARETEKEKRVDQREGGRDAIGTIYAIERD